MAHVKNPKKKFLWRLTFVKHACNPYLWQKVTIPGITIEQVKHSDGNRDVKTPGRIEVDNLKCEKLETTSGSDTWMEDWLNACQDQLLGGGLIPSEAWETVMVEELAEDGVSVLNTWILSEVWPCKRNDRDLDKTTSDNLLDSCEFSVGTCQKM